MVDLLRVICFYYGIIVYGLYTLVHASSSEGNVLIVVRCYGEYIPGNTSLLHTMADCVIFFGEFFVYPPCIKNLGKVHYDNVCSISDINQS